MSTTLEGRVTTVERWLEKTVYAQFEYQMKLDTFHEEMREFKDEMTDFKREMTDFKREMAEFKDEMAEFKDEMAEFKDEQRRDRREMNVKWGELANKMGTIVEDIVMPNLPGILRNHFGVDQPLMTAPRIRRRHPGDPSRLREFDAVIVTEDTVFINETKSTVRFADIERFAASHREVLEYFPEYAGYTVIPIMSSLHMPTEIVAALTERSIFAMAMGEENMALLNAAELGRPGATER
jgi:phage-related minor tail protein